MIPKHKNWPKQDKTNKQTKFHRIIPIVTFNIHLPHFDNNSQLAFLFSDALRKLVQIFSTSSSK